MNMTFNFDNKYDKKNSDEKIIEAIKFLIEQYTFVTMKDTDEIYYYDSGSGIYVNGGEVFIKSELAAMHTYIPSHHIKEIIQLII